MAGWVKSLPCNHRKLSVILRKHVRRKRKPRCAIARISSQHWGGGDRYIPVDHSFACQSIKPVSFRLLRDSVLKGNRTEAWGLILKVVLWPSYSYAPPWVCASCPELLETCAWNWCDLFENRDGNIKVISVHNQLGRKACNFFFFVYAVAVMQNDW